MKSWCDLRGPSCSCDCGCDCERCERRRGVLVLRRRTARYSMVRRLVSHIELDWSEAVRPGTGMGMTKHGMAGVVWFIDRDLIETIYWCI